MNFLFSSAIIFAMVVGANARVGETRKTSLCSPPWGQCGGKLYFGPACCAAGYECVTDNEWWSQCKPAPVDEGCLPAWARCGGIGHTGSTCCTTGYDCVEDSEWYSQCRPSPGQCKAPWTQCGGNGYNGATCCTEGYTCVEDSEWWSACKPGNPDTSAPTTAPSVAPTTQAPSGLPTKGPTATPTTTPTAAPTETPTATPTLSPSEAPTTDAPTSTPTMAPTTQPPTVFPSEAPTTGMPTGAPTTAAPTSSPTKARSFGAMKTCVVTGDPHWTTFSGVTHDFMGPTTSKSQHYYVAPCGGPSVKDPPFRILGGHYNWGSGNSGAGLELLTLELEDTDGSVYYVWMSANVHSYGTGNQNSHDYDANDPSTMVTLTSNVQTTIGASFQVLYTQHSGREASVSLTVDGNKVVEIFMRGQTRYFAGRFRQHTALIKVDTAYEDELCGLCGPLDTSSSSFQACGGSMLDIPTQSINPSNYQTFVDQDGWTYERDFYLNSCGSYYDITDNAVAGSVYPKQCDGFISDQVQQECENAKSAAEGSSRCNGDLATFCTNLVTSCSIDACVEANGDVTAISDAVQTSFTDVIDFMNQYY